MRTFLRAVLAALVVTLILSGTETVAAYPRPSEASSAFFNTAFFTYLPLSLAFSLLASVLAPVRGLDLWLPFMIGTLRLAGAWVAGVQEGGWVIGLVVLILLIAVARLGLWAGPEDSSPPFLFGLTVGIVLPILAARVFLVQAGRVGGPTTASQMGVLAGLLTFVLLRAFVARWPRVGPVFLLGPVVSLALWSRGSQEAPAVRSSSPKPDDRRPDIALIVLDTVRARALSSYGNHHDTMPGLERFARTATRFERVWTNGSWTLPGHASLFSGLRVSRHRYDSGFAESERRPPDRFLAARLQRSGYATAAVAANFGVFAREAPLLSGFERSDAEPLRPFVFRPWLFDLLNWFPRSAWLKTAVSRFPGPSMRAPWVVDRALAFWSRPADRPRFLFVNFMEAHMPWVPEATDVGAFGPRGLEAESEQIAVLGTYLRHGRPSASEVEVLRARYEESLKSLDRSLTRLLDALSSGNQGREVIVVVTADHGESLGEHDRFGHRNSLDEEATRIPLIIRGPGLDPGINSSLVELADVFGYVLASAELRPDPGLDSVPFGSRRFVLLEHRPGPQGALPSSYPRGDLSAVVDWPFKYIDGAPEGAGLFDLASDPHETKNLAAREPGRLEAMKSLMKTLAGPGSGPAATDAATEERLRALGYVR